MQFTTYNLLDLDTPVLLPENYKVIQLEGNKIEYENAAGELKSSDLYIHHTDNLVLVDEFRRYIEHDSILIILFSEDFKNIILQIRNDHVQWEPGKVDLASIAAQRRAELSGKRFQKMDNIKLAYKKTIEETALSQTRVENYKFIEVGQHINRLTNEFQTIFVCKTDTNSTELNRLLDKVPEIDRPKEWLEQNYNQTIKDYFSSDDVAMKYAGGLELREKGFLSNNSIREKINQIISP